MTERKNSARFVEPDAPVSAKSTQEPSTQTQTSPAQQTFFVELPSKGRFYPEGHPWKDKESVELRVMTLAQQDILTNPSYLQKGVVFEKLLSSILVENVDLETIYLGDKDALLLGARIDGYGEEFQVQMTCPACGTKQKSVFNLQELLEKEVEVNVDKLPEFEETETGFKTKLPKTQKEVEVKFFTGKEEREIEQVLAKQKKYKLPQQRSTEEMKKAIVSVDGEKGGAVEKLVVSLTMRDANHIQTLVKALKPQVSNKGTFQCENEECGFKKEITIPFSTDLFWPQ